LAFLFLTIRTTSVRRLCGVLLFDSFLPLCKYLNVLHLLQLVVIVKPKQSCTKSTTITVRSVLLFRSTLAYFLNH